MIAMFFVQLLITLFSLYLAAITAYLCVITVAAYFFRKKTSPGGKPLKLAVVIPAHNEEDRIAETIDFLTKSSYEKPFYSIIVIADNCNDRTEELASAAGALVFRRTDPTERGKGQALDWFFRRHKHAYESADAVVMIDADTTVDEYFLSEMAASLKHPSVRVVQGYYGVSNADQHWRSALLSAAFHVFNHLRPAGISRLGGTAGLRGNGMGFRRDLISDEGWPAHSIVEDHEFTLRLLLKGIVVHYNPDARVFSDMPVNRKVAERQRMRWEGMDRGMNRTLRRLVFKKALKDRQPRYVHALAGFFVPPLAKVVAEQVTVFAAALAVHSNMTVLLAVCFGVDLLYVFSGLILRGASSAEWLSLLRAPFYILWKLRIYARMLGGTPLAWERTSRPSELKG
jgi:1,2-diacylglycerol 3-beta-glucosyltransferase